MRVIDYIANLKLRDEEEVGHFNELSCLSYLATGLRYLYEQVKSVEAEVNKRLPRSKEYFGFGNAPGMEGVNQALVACAFHWYAVTACNYVKMVGWLSNNGDSNKAREYMKSVLPQVYLWRNKVAAHFARVEPEDDSPADLAMSVMFPISFEKNAFYTTTGSLTLTMSGGGKQSTSRQDMRWSMTHTHCDLIDRYWRRSED
jgi:hypothetical protein